MIAGVARDTLSEIAERVNALRVYGDKSNSITESIKHHLMTIKEVAASRLEHGYATRNWLRAVTDVVTDLIDLVEDAALLPKRSKIASLLSRCDHKQLFQLKQIEKELQEVAADAAKLSDANRQDIKIVGRESEKEEIVRLILSKANGEGLLSSTAIFGDEGIGKTTLAKCICDDDRVKSHFDLIIWIEDIRHDSYAELVVKRMIESVDEGGVVTGESLGVGEATKGRRFLLVLDDLQNQSHGEWDKLLQMLMKAAGVALLVTTHSFWVAHMIGFSNGFFLDGLDEEKSWSLFEKFAGGGPSLSDSKTKSVLRKMVEVCMGVPLAILIMAMLVRLKSPTEIAESAEDELKYEFKQEIQMLIYYYDLPSWHLKQCFTYSSLIFSSGYEKVLDSVKAETLIRLWMAKGFLGPVNCSPLLQPEDIGEQYMREFEDRSIFRFSTYETKHRTLQSCSMHVNRLHSSETIFDDNLLMDNPDKHVKESVRRVSLTSELDVSKGIPKPLFEKATQLQTFLFPASRGSRVPHELMLSWSVCDAIFSTFKRLRVLILQDMGMKALPPSIGKLKSLRYLDLSYNNMKTLPRCIGELKYLQTLILSHCHELTELPDGVNYFASLRHLELEECLHLTHMPSALKMLTSLRTLSHFVTSSTSKKNSQRGGLWELVDLNNLRGELEILHLERLRLREQGQCGYNYLRGKQYLHGLTLRWNHNRNERRNGAHDSESFRYLEPHPNLQALSIVGYEGIEFSNWLTSLENLVKFSLYNCSKCERLPPLDRLPKLEILQLQRLDSLEYIIDNHDNQPVESFFTSLKELKISDCPKLTSWWKGRSHNNARFHSLSKLEVQYCPKLDCMPLYPDLDVELVLVSCSLKPLHDTLGYTPASASSSTNTSRTDSDPENPPPLSKLRKFILAGVEEQHNTLPEGWLKNFTSLWRLEIRACEGLKSLMTGFKHLTSLYGLYIVNCTESELPSGEWEEALQDLCYLYIMEMPNLKSLPVGIEHLSSLEELTIESCPELTTLTEGISKLENLTSLSLKDCSKLASLPQELSKVTSLSELRIRNCRKLFPRCQRETGDDWPQIKHIEDVFISDTSEYYE